MDAINQMIHQHPTGFGLAVLAIAFLIVLLLCWVSE